ncbi:MAG: phospholipase [Actinomycetota bacterium]|jgi:phospholipase C|nr:phospholipase [Actinomycetota bacterium]
MSDNSFGTTFGPSTPGALNLVAGQTHGFARTSLAVTANSTMVGDSQPAGDKCNTRNTTVSNDPKNKDVGDLLNTHRYDVGLVPGRFRRLQGLPQQRRGGEQCRLHPSPSADYIPHHEPFQYFPSTANTQHTRPASVSEIGHAGPANHQ